MSDTREKLIDIVEYCVDFLSRDTKDYLVDAIEELFATDNNVGGKWIPVSERLPDPYISVLVRKQQLGSQQLFTTVDRIVIGYGGIEIWFGDIGTWKTNVTHWMPLPEPPKGE